MALATRLRAAPPADRMRDEPREWGRGEVVITPHRPPPEPDAVPPDNSPSYWAAGMPREVLERAVENSLIFGIYDGSRQVGFARAITDLATYAYLSDVFVIEGYRDRRLSKWLMECVLPPLSHQGLRRFA